MGSPSTSPSAAPAVSSSPLAAGCGGCGSLLTVGGELGRHGRGLLDDLLDGADHVEGGLGQVVVLALEQALEAGDGLLERDELARLAREDLGHVEGLRHEALDLARARDGHLVVLGELVSS